MSSPGASTGHSYEWTGVWQNRLPDFLLEDVASLCLQPIYVVERSFHCTARSACCLYLRVSAQPANLKQFVIGPELEHDQHSLVDLTSQRAEESFAGCLLTIGIAAHDTQAVLKTVKHPRWVSLQRWRQHNIAFMSQS